MIKPASQSSPALKTAAEAGKAAATGHYPGAERGGQKQEIGLRSTEFRKGRETSWTALDNLISRMESKGIGDLSADEVRRLPLLYRSTVSSLSVARSIVLDRNLLLYLENISLRAYIAVYGPRTGLLESIRRLFCRDFPAGVRALRWHLLIVSLVFMAGVLAGYMLTMGDMNYYNLIIPESLAGSRGPESTVQELRENGLFAPWEGFVDGFMVFATYLFQHNSIVAIMAFGLGFALGIPTVLLIAYNGLVIGAFLALHADKGLLFDCIGWLSIHGVTEILAILLCGAAGLALAEKIIFPGKLPRLENLARNGRVAATVAIGAVAMLFIAGFLEGGFRQLISNTIARYAVALLSGGLWLYYFTRMGKAEFNEEHGTEN